MNVNTISLPTMDLFCIEVNREPKAISDPVFLDDDRILKNLMLTEERYTISSSYFKCFQTELKPHMRKVVANWMLEVCVTVQSTPVAPTPPPPAIPILYHSLSLQMLICSQNNVFISNTFISYTKGLLSLKHVVIQFLIK